MDTEKTLVQRQFDNEELAIALGVENYITTQRKAEKRSDATALAPQNYLLRESITKVADAIRAQMTTQKGGGGGYQNVRKVVSLAGCETIAFIAIKACLDVISEQSLIKLSKNITTDIVMHLDYMIFKKAMPGYVKAIEKTMDSKSCSYKINVLRNHMGKQDVPTFPRFASKDATQLGCYFIYKIIESVDLYELQLRNVGKKQQRWVVPTPLTVQWLENAHQDCAELSVQFLPMLVKPAKWESMYSGGFLNCAGQYKIPAVRTRSNSVRAELSRADLSADYAAVNALQETPFKINKRVLEIMQICKESELGGGLPQGSVELALPSKPWATEKQYREMCGSDPKVVKKWKMETARAYESFHRELSKRQTLHWQMWTADRFKDDKEIFFVWNMDWRGRKYPVQPYLNPQTDQFGKSLLEFSEGDPLGEHGAYWMMIHGANVFGRDHDDMPVRVQWIKDHSDLIVDSAKNPLDGERFWMKGDKPFQCLAFAFAWAEYLEQGDDYVCCLPGAVDGSCSGLQHYSALLRDEIGGKYTNLIPQSSPSDIYMKVAEVSAAIVAKDTINPFAELWNGKIDRAIVKPNSMTYAYSATLFGMSDQIREELKKKDRKEESGNYLGGEKAGMGKAAMYLARTNLTAISSVVVKAAEAMAWFKEVAGIITKAGHNFRWTSPSGMVIIHKYLKFKTKTVDTFHGKTRIRVAVAEYTDVPNPAKNKSGVAPNFTHGNDAAHVTLTVNACVAEGMKAFAFIHDSFGCTFGNMQRMNEILRETFIKMYSTEILANFMAQLKSQLPAEVYELLPEPPKMGTLDLNQVRKSVYFFA